VQIEPDIVTRLGGWLFRHRTALPLPVAAAILVLRTGQAPPSPGLLAAGIGATMAGELLRLWAVHYIGVISRTRSDRLGPLVASGPFAIVRNPLYVGNIALWVGFALTARLIWLAPVILVLLGAEYHAIVRWEERVLESRLGEAYRVYAARVPRWLPTFNRGARPSTGSGRAYQEPLMVSLSNHEHSADAAVKPYSLRETVFSERGTLLAIAAGYLLLWIKLLTSSF
jgi:protein-S-isoprenylcysteine O-methyltransferase Ste14